jgi:hypothetical protein
LLTFEDLFHFRVEVQLASSGFRQHGSEPLGYAFVDLRVPTHPPHVLLAFLPATPNRLLLP